MFLYPLKYYNDYDNDAHGNNNRKKKIKNLECSKNEYVQITSIYNKAWWQ